MTTIEGSVDLSKMLVRADRLIRRMDYAAQRGMRVVEMDEGVLAHLAEVASRPGLQVTIEWPAPDEDGFTTPIMRTKQTDIEGTPV